MDDIDHEVNRICAEYCEMQQPPAVNAKFWAGVSNAIASMLLMAAVGYVVGLACSKAYEWVLR